MNRKFHLPFQDITPEGWLNLALAATLAFYIIQIGYLLFNGNICKDVAFDYCAYWSAGKIINQGRIGEIYYLDLLTQFQKEIYPQANISSVPFKPVEVPYLPIFILPFIFLSLLKLQFSFFIWTAINLIGFIFYIRFFTKEVTGHSLPIKLFLMILLSIPVFVNLIEGQLNIWLVICAGEFMRATLSDKQIKAGLWLGGWLLKPQLLILIIPFLMIQNSVKMLKGFFLSTIAILLISFALIDINGFLNLKSILLESAGGGATSHPEAMMNWRMLGWHIGFITSSLLGWAVIIVGTLLTVGITLYVFRKKKTSEPTELVIALLGIFSATCVVTWHAHVHMSMILIPPLLYLFIKDQFKKNVFIAWIFVPILTHLISYVLATVIILIFEFIPFEIYQITHFLGAAPFFIINILILGQAISLYTRTQEDITYIDQFMN